MESKTKFNLDKSISDWKSELFKFGNMTNDNLAELECHLLDEIDALENLGLSIEESFLIAKNRIGNVKELTNEFDKVNKKVYFRNRIIPYIKGGLLIISFMSILNLILEILFLITQKQGVSDTYQNFILIGLLVLLTTSIVIVSYKKYKSHRFSMPRLASIPILVSIIIVSKLFSFVWLTILKHSPMSFSSYGTLQMTLTIYRLLFGLFILTFCCLMFYYSKKGNKIKIAE